MTGVSVLLFEPDASARRMVADGLREMGHNPTLARDSTHAIELLRAMRFEMVIAAIEEEGSDGLELAALARSGKGGASVVIVFLVTTESLRRVRPLLAVGPVEVICKPLESAWLEARLTIAGRLLGERVERADDRVRLSDARMLVEHSTQGLIVFQHQRAVFANGAATQLTGYSDVELMTMDPEDLRSLVHPDDRESLVTDVTERKSALALPGRAEFRVLRKDGSMRWLESRFSHIEYGGEPAVQMSSVDITERKEAEDARKRSEERFRTLYAESPIGILLYDDRGEPADINPACMRIFGIEALAQVPNMFDTLAVFPDPGASDEARARLARGEAFRYEFALNFARGVSQGLPQTSKKGSIDIDVLITPLPGKREGGPAGFLAQVQDVTDRRLVEKSLVLAFRDMRKLLDSVPECIVVHRNERLLYVNAHGLASFGHVVLDEVLGRRLLEFLKPQDPEAARECLLELSSPDGSARTRELRVLGTGGEAMLLEVTGGPAIEFEGGPASLLLARDVSERKKLETRLLLADRMASLGTLAAGVAHEINNPLSYVMANVSHVATELGRRAEEASGLKVSRSDEPQPAPESLGAAPGVAPEGADDLREALDEALVGVERIRRIVTDLKTFSRPDDDRRGSVDVRRVLEGAANMAANEIRHRARLVKEYAAVPPVCGSEARLGQVFLNLLVNAAQALPVGQASRNEIRVRVVPESGGRVAVEVTDSGPGIPEDVLRRVFDPFFTTKPVGEGTGLGLSICHAIVKSLGGEIVMDSALGRGTTVRVLLLAAARVEEAPCGTRASAGAPPRRRILIVDDEPLFASAIRRLLQQEHDVTIVESGRDAVRLLMERDFDLVLCDLMMPEVSGIDVYNEVRRARPGFEKRLAFMTGGAFTQGARQFLETVPNARLDKPFTKDEVRAVVRRVVGGEGTPS